MANTPHIETALERAELALTLLAVDPLGLAGAVIAARPGPVLDRWLASLKALVPESPWRKLPLGIDDARLLGGLDLPATLALGRPISERGLLADADGGFLQISNAELLDADLAGRITAALDTGRVVAQRDGLSIADDARVSVIAINGAVDADQRVSEALCDRVAFRIDLHGIPMREPCGTPPSPDALRRARALYPRVSASSEDITALTAAALTLGIASLRAPLFAVKAARCLAALEGRDSLASQDLEVAAALVLAPIATVIPDAAREDEPPPAPSEEPPSAPETPAPESRELTAEELMDLVIAAARAALPDHLLSTMSGAPSQSASRSSGRSGLEVRGVHRGRRAGTRRRRGRMGERIAIVETLRAAVPWQSLRRRDRALSGTTMAGLIELRGEDIRIFRTVDRRETSTIFVVDASGSSALARLNEAKGAVELLLSDCYVRRDQVGLIAFRNRSAEILLEPTRSLARAKRSLAALPGGGGTPLAHAIEAAHRAALAARKKGRTPTLVFLTDARANVDRRGAGGREAAERDALEAAREIAAAGIATLLIDTSTKTQPQGKALADALRATYVPLPRARADTVSDIVRAKLAS